MITYKTWSKRVGLSLYKYEAWYLFGCILFGCILLYLKKYERDE